MSNLPARRQDRLGLEAQLRPSFPTLADALTSDDAIPYVPAAVAARALPYAEDACAPASHDELTFALGYLASVTTGDKLRSPETMQVSARALVQAMQEYPASAALGAIRDWPKGDNGKWWPTENELRAEADARGWQATRLYRHLRAATARSDASAPRTNEPSSSLKEFIEEVTRTHGEPFVKSWLSPLTCQYQGKTIWTHPFGAERLKERAGKLLERFDIVVCSDEEARTHFRNATAHLEPRKDARR